MKKAKKESKKAKPGDKRLGNKFWQLRSKHGRDKLFETPELLWTAACEYFKWCDANPLKEEKVFHAQGIITKTKISKMRAYTIGAFLLYIRASENYLQEFKHAQGEKEGQEAIDFLGVIREIEQTIYNQKFTGASADLLNANIIARDLGLSDRQELTGKDGESLIPTLTDEELLQRINKLSKQGK